MRETEPVRYALALLALVAAVAAGVTLRGDRACESARLTVFADPRDDAAVERVRDTCRGTTGRLAVAGRLAAAGRRPQALRLAREAAEEEPDNVVAWRGVAATASGAEARAASRRVGELDPRSLRRSSGRSTK